jgi:hypothetical protein
VLLNLSCGWGIRKHSNDLSISLKMETTSRISHAQVPHPEQQAATLVVFDVLHSGVYLVHGIALLDVQQ